MKSSTFVINIISHENKSTPYNPQRAAPEFFSKTTKNKIDYDTGLIRLRRITHNCNGFFACITNSVEEKAAKKLLEYISNPPKFKNTFTLREYKALSQLMLVEAVALLRPHLSFVGIPIEEIHLVKSIKVEDKKRDKLSLSL